MTERNELEKTIEALQAQRAILGDEVVDTALEPLREKLRALELAEGKRQRKQATIMFADVSGFTTLTETMDAEDVTDMINALWNRLDSVIVRHGGRIDKHIGDAIMALWGTPVANEDDPEQAIRAALAMQDEIQEFVGSHEGVPQTEPLQLRIGINTGPVLLGEVGTTGEFTAIGDAVNLASRLEDAAPVGGTLISHQTYSHVRGLFNVETLDEIQVKGKIEPIKVYLIKSVKPRAFRIPTRGVRGVETRMIARESEFKQLKESFFKAIEDHKTQIVTVVGEAGVGKSRLLYEFSNWVELEPVDLVVFQGRAIQETHHSPFSLIRDLFSFGFEIHDNVTASIARNRFKNGILEFIHDDPDAEAKAHFIGHLIGFDFSQSPYLKGIMTDARQIRGRAFGYFVQFLKAVAQKKPVVIYLEDIHWADDGSLDLIAHLVREEENLPLMVLSLARPNLFGKDPSWGQGRRSFTQLDLTRLDLRTLSEQESHKLVQEILKKIPEIPLILMNLVVQGGGGNPYYIEELIKVLIEDDVILMGEDQWSIARERLAEVRVPPTLTGVVQARLDRLDSLEREILQAASLVGRVFWDGAITHCTSHSRKTSRDILDTLMGRELIFERSGSSFMGEREFIFKHILLHDITYESVLKSQRRENHAKIAAWLIDRSGEQVDQYAGRIAEHYQLAGEKIAAATWFGRAGERAKDTYAPQDAIDYFKKALELMPDDLAYVPQKTTYYKHLGELFDWQNRLDDAESAVLSMRSLAESIGDAEAESHACIKLSVLQERRGHYRDALESAEEGVNIAKEAKLSGNLAWAYLYKGKYAYMLGEIETAVVSAEQALAFSHDLDEEKTVVRAGSLTVLSFAKGLMGHYEQALAYQEEVLEIRRNAGDIRGEMDTLINMGALATRAGYDKALEYYEDAFEIAQKIDDQNNQIGILSDIGALRVDRGEYKLAESTLREAIQASEKVGDRLSQVYATLNLAQALIGQRKVALAYSVAQRTLVMMLSMEWQEWLGDAWRVMARCLVEEASPDHVMLGGRTLNARDCFEESVGAFKELDYADKQAAVLREWAQYEDERGDKALSESLLAQADKILHQMEMEEEVSHMDHGH